MISANDLRNVQLHSDAEGYNREEVNAVIAQAADTIDAYVNENKGLYHKLEILAAKIEEYRSEEDSIKTALITAQKMADKIEQETKEKNEQLAAQAQADASAVKAEAQASAEKTVSEARAFASSLLQTKNDEAAAIVADAEKKANDAINSSKIVAQDILDQAKQISDDLISTSKEENEAYLLLNKALKKDAAEFIEKLKALYSEQLEALNGAKLEAGESLKEQEIEQLGNQRSNLVSEIDEIKAAIPSEVTIEAKIDGPETVEEPEQTEEPAPIEEPVAETPAEPEDEPEQITLAEPVEEPEEESEPVDAMEAVKAFSTDEITPVDATAGNYHEITEEPEMEKSLFEEEHQPFEDYFKVSKKDAHLDKTQTISLVPPEDFNADEDDDESSHKGFFRKRK